MKNKNKLTISNKLLQRFNTSETILVISGYPSRKKNGTSHGVDWYTKTVLEPIATRTGQKFVVLADVNCDNRPQLRSGGRILVLRIFDKTKIHLYPQILEWLHFFSQIKKVVVHSEFCSKGKLWQYALLIPFLGLIRLAGRSITFFSHNVIADIGQLSGHLNIHANSTRAKIINFGLRLYYLSLALICHKIVVLDQTLAMILKKFMPESKILQTTIPVANKLKTLSKNKAKKLLGIPADHKVMINFGFVSWYKGADWIINTFDTLTKSGKLRKTTLLVAGGPTPSLENEPHYRSYYQKLLKKAASNNHIVISGFIPESEVGSYFAASDLMVLPYRTLMGASGCLTHALSYKLPFVISTQMRKLLNSPDVADVIANNKISKRDLTFTLTSQSLAKVGKTLKNPVLLKKLKQVSGDIAATRKINAVSMRDYHGIYSAPTEAQSFNMIKFLPALKSRI